MINTPRQALRTGKGSFVTTPDQQTTLRKRSYTGNMWRVLFYLATTIAILMLMTLILSIINSAFGYVAIAYTRQPETIIAELDNASAYRIEDLSTFELEEIIRLNVRPARIRVYEQEATLRERSREELLVIISEEVLEPRIEKSWNLSESIFSPQAIREWQRKNLPQGWLQFRAWVNFAFLAKDLSNIPEQAGLKKPILGSLMVILITIIFAFPIGVGTAIYLEEYAPDNKFNRLLQINIYNLSGVPSIVYGLLGLAVFVRILEPITSGSIFGYIDSGTTANGRTIFSAGLTLALLILPIIVINAQEAIRAVPISLRQASYALGASRWQTIFYHVLPASMDRILTGTIIAVSRAIGETAPLVVIGASAFLTKDPTSIFDKFTTLPIMIYRWTSYPQEEFRHLASAAIIVLLIILLSLNAGAVIMRNKISKKRRLGF